jgi:hypothetical protein
MGDDTKQRFNVHLIGAGEPLRIDAHHFHFDLQHDLILFYKSETEVDDRFLIFRSGVSCDPFA